MPLIRFREAHSSTVRVGSIEDGAVIPFAPGISLSELLHSSDPRGASLANREPHARPLPLDSVTILKPIEDQEVWGAGVTYERSRIARQEESETGGTFYDQVYTADRPELFLKATPSRVVGPEAAIRIRADSVWSVPEPELALVLSPTLSLVGYTIGNDVSARDIEGRNPLYLPQAKVYAACCSLGPGITLAADLPDPEALTIQLRIHRGGKLHWSSQTSTSRMARRFQELIDWLGRDNLFPNGVILLTGTGIVPPDEFSLAPGDRVEIEIDGLGVLANPVEQHLAQTP